MRNQNWRDPQKDKAWKLERKVRAKKKNRGWKKREEKWSYGDPKNSK